MIRKMCLAVLFVIIAIPGYAGHGTIVETDTQFIVEYYGDEKDTDAYKLLKEEEQKNEEAVVRAKANTAAKKQESSAFHEARKKARREEE